MTKVTSKLQVSLPKALADQYGIRPGDDLAWEAAGDIIRVIPPGRNNLDHPSHDRLWLFDQATARQHQRNTTHKSLVNPDDRGWSRDELYGNRGRSD